MISRESAQSWLAAHGRIDDRRRGRWTVPTQDDDVRQQLANMTQLYQHMRADRDRLSNEVALRTLAMQLRIRNDAVSEAESQQAQAARLLLEAAQAQARAADALRRGSRPKTTLSANSSSQVHSTMSSQTLQVFRSNLCGL